MYKKIWTYQFLERDCVSKFHSVLMKMNAAEQPTKQRKEGITNAVGSSSRTLSQIFCLNFPGLSIMRLILTIAEQNAINSIHLFILLGRVE